jgi:transcriptional regulator NrdR family protein
MICPNCKHHEHRVLRSKAKDGAIRRTRECERCRHAWTTLELEEQQLAEDRATLARARELAATLVPG